MEHSPSREANSSLVGQKMFGILWNSNVRYRVHNSSPLVRALSQIKTVYAFQLLFLKTNFTINLPSKARSSKWPFSLNFAHHSPVCTSPLSQNSTTPCNQTNNNNNKNYLL